MTEELTLFNYQNECEPCWRWYKESMCWNCEKFKPGKTCHCGTCSECETAMDSDDWYHQFFAGCEYNNKKGRKYIEYERMNK